MSAAFSAPATVALFHTLPRPYRACERCIHSEVPVGSSRLLCVHPEAQRHSPGGHQLVEQARARGGHCGPDALRLDDPRLRP